VSALAPAEIEKFKVRFNHMAYYREWMRDPEAVKWAIAFVAERSEEIERLAPRNLTSKKAQVCEQASLQSPLGLE